MTKLWQYFMCVLWVSFSLLWQNGYHVNVFFLYFFDFFLCFLPNKSHLYRYIILLSSSKKVHSSFVHLPPSVLHLLWLRAKILFFYNFSACRTQSKLVQPSFLFSTFQGLSTFSPCDRKKKNRLTWRVLWNKKWWTKKFPVI